ncbi:alcohol dehydrogenase catalytic domain-containing protein [Rhodococcus sovatensis]|uniref:Alcohol dehydrogenase catalytic domain-containing protein n=1 Tax=Rhodococcus sovatensis TaxID=1805840 RepID=A0ABZ2PNS7_9NOCA
MISLQLHGEQDLRLEDVQVAEVGKGDVKIKVAYNGICGSDLHFYYAASRSGWSRPRNIGHEISGVVAEVGSDVSDVSVGDRVSVYPIDSCGSCVQCVDGHPVLCEVLDRSVSTVGCGSPIGGMGEYCVVPNHLIIPLPDGLSLAQGALVEPIAVAATAVERAQLKADSVVVVSGGGPIGIGAVLSLEAMGITNFVVSEPSEARRAALTNLTSARVIDPTSEDLPAIVRELSGGRGADVVLECAGAGAAFDAALAIVRKRGKIVMIGLFEKPYQLLPNGIALNEISIVGHNGSTQDVFRTVMRWMEEGKIPTDSWVTYVPLAESVEGGFEPLRRGEEIKVLVDIAGSSSEE